MSFLIGAVLGATLGVIIGGFNRANSEADWFTLGYLKGREHEAGIQHLEDWAEYERPA